MPFGEYVPLRRQLSGLRIGRVDMILRNMIPGTRARPLEVAGTRVVDLTGLAVAYDDSLASSHPRHDGVIGPNGAVRTELAPRSTDVAVAEVALVDAQTPAVRYGTAMRQALTLRGGFAVVVALLRHRRLRTPHPAVRGSR